MCVLILLYVSANIHANTSPTQAFFYTHIHVSSYDIYQYMCPQYTCVLILDI